MSSNSARALASTLAFNCRHTDARLADACLAGVGKHAAKLVYELARRVRNRASENTCCRREARGPGVSATGGAGTGEGEGEV